MRRKDLMNVYQKVQTKYSFPNDLEDEQVDCLLNLMHGNNVVCLNQTGFRKTDIFTLYPLLLDEYRPVSEGRNIAIVISPVTLHVQDQITSIQSKNVSAVVLNGELSENQVKGIKHGDFSVLLVTQEALLEEDHWREFILDNPLYKSNSCLIAFDEPLLICKWEETLREASDAYYLLSLIRSTLTTCRVLFFTASPTKRDLRKCLDFLHTDIDRVKIVAKSCVRPNIFLGFKCEKNMKELTELDWYLDMLKNDGIRAPKCIIYSTLDTAVDLYGEIMSALGKKAYCGTRSAETRMVTMFHDVPVSTEGMQRMVLTNFAPTDGPIRLVIASCAFGLGAIDIPVKYIIHWGHPPTLTEYWQQVTQAGSDGSSAFGFYYVPKPKVGSASTNSRDLIEGLNKGTIQCIRTYMLEQLETSEKDKDYAKDLGGRELCITSNECRTAECCACSLCSCCTFCWRRCDCSLKVGGSERLH